MFNRVLKVKRLYKCHYFLDKKIPRLQTDSYCAYAENLFSVADIDEDGLNEVGIYYSGCAGRYKSLIIYTLKKGKWKEIGHSIFDILTQDPTEVVYQELVKKTSKNRFKILNFENDKKYWKSYKI
jgi:hypothetical protein